MTDDRTPQTTDPPNLKGSWQPHSFWIWNERGGWEVVARMRVCGYFARVEDQDGDKSVWEVSKDRVEVASGEFPEWQDGSYVSNHYELALHAAEQTLRKLGVLS